MSPKIAMHMTQENIFSLYENNIQLANWQSFHNCTSFPVP